MGKAIVLNRFPSTWCHYYLVSLLLGVTTTWCHYYLVSLLLGVTTRLG
jgi:hypothetical protein